MNVFNQRVRAVLRREYLQRVKNKWFIVTTLLIPALMIGGMLLTVWLAERTPTESQTLQVGVVDRTALGLAGRLQGTFRGEGSDASQVTLPGQGGQMPRAPAVALAVDARATVEMAVAEIPPDVGLTELGDLLADTPFDVLLYLPPDLAPPLQAVVPDTGAASVPPSPELRIVARQSVSSAHERVIGAAVQEAVVAALLEQSGARALQASQVLAAADLRPEVLRTDREGARSQEAMTGLAIAFGMALYFMLLVYGSMIVRGVIEEKTSDVVEVLISSLRPWEMMLGKILGVGAVGLTQVAIWGLVMAGLVIYGLTAAGPALAEAGIELRMLSTSLLPILLAFLAFFLLGYLLYASLFAAAGALASGDQDAQQVSLPITIFIVAAIFLLLPMIETPDATWAILVSQIPLFSPILMVARVTGGMAGTAEIVSALLLLLLGVAAAVWLAGRVYRVGILMKGKRPNLPELVRWVRYG